MVFLRDTLVQETPRCIDGFLPSREGAPGGLNRASGFPFPL